MPPKSPQSDSDNFDFDFDIGGSGASDKAKPTPVAEPKDEVIRKPRARQADAAPPAKKKIAQEPADEDLVIRRAAAKPRPKPKPAEPAPEVPEAPPKQAEQRPKPAAESQAVIQKRRTEPLAEPQPAPQRMEQRAIPAAEPPTKPPVEPGAGKRTEPAVRDIPVSLPPVKQKSAVDPRPVPNPFTPESYLEEEIHELDQIEDLVIEPMAQPVDRRRQERAETVQRDFQPSAQHARQKWGISPRLAIGVGLVAVAALAAFLKLRSGGDDSPGPGTSPADNPTPPASVPAGFAGDPLPPSAAETLVDIKARISDTLGKYFGAAASDDLLPLIRHRERVAPLVKEYYQRKGFALPALQAVGRTEEIMVNLKTFWIADVTLAGKLARTVVLEDTDRGFVVDWEEFVSYNPIDWEEFATTRPSGRRPFRVLATLDHRPGYAFPDPAKWLCVRLTTRGSEEALYGYVAAGTALAAKLEEMLTNELTKEWEYPCILELEFPSNPQGGEDQLHIRDLVIEHWVVVD